MHFASDNAGPVHPAVLDALARANDGRALGYGNDPLTARVTDRLRALFEAPEASVYLVPTGTAANALALSCLAQPYQSIFCAELAHIQIDECSAPEFYTGGAKLVPLPSGDMIEPAALESAIRSGIDWGVHGPEPAALSLTTVTEGGNVLSLDQLRDLCGVARQGGLGVHLDGARFANACAVLGCTPAEMTWKAGVDIAVFGGTKNGLMGAEAIIVFDPARARGLDRRRKRAGHLFSKHRYLAAQMDAFLTDELWLSLARKANAAAARLRAGLMARGVAIDNATQANMIFFRVPRRVHAALQDAGAVYALYAPSEGAPEEPIPGRLVCDWSMDDTPVDQFLAALDTAMETAHA